MFCVPKAAVLHGKSVGFASQKSRFRNVKSKLPFLKEIIFTKSRLLLGLVLELLEDSSFSRIYRLSHFAWVLGRCAQHTYTHAVELENYCFWASFFFFFFRLNNSLK
ncbi:hypothetical protein CTM58_12600 [Prevotella intermedia]|uniref:Uncharacterized protein n=1 Tax=Prevotella intermedia TaxID=28131 RepID=A0A2M8TRG5_PREIN|nr:hypothetical protein CTM58_12600 [Prevotella intermedia]